jgi:hypothetical protein
MPRALLAFPPSGPVAIVLISAAVAATGIITTPIDRNGQVVYLDDLQYTWKQ